MRRGALLLTGTEIVSDLPHHGLEDHIMYHVGEWGSKEFDLLKDLEGNAILQDIEQLDPNCWATLVVASVRIPRECAFTYPKLARAHLEFLEEDVDTAIRTGNS